MYTDALCIILKVEDTMVLWLLVMFSKFLFTFLLYGFFSLENENSLSYLISSYIVLDLETPSFSACRRFLCIQF